MLDAMQGLWDQLKEMGVKIIAVRQQRETEGVTFLLVLR
jgi:hypothetical protein